MSRVSLLIITVISVLLTSPAFSETVNTQWVEPYSLKMNAEFEHKQGENLLYTSHITGPLKLNIRPGLNNPLEGQIQTGIGKHTRGLGIFFKPYDEEINIATGSVPCIITASDVTAEKLDQWMKLKSQENPALKVSLVPILSDLQVDEIGPLTPLFSQYRNPESVDGNIFVLDTTGKKPQYKYFAKITIPAFKFQLNMVPGNNGQEMEVHLNNVSLTDLSVEMWEKILKQGNQHLALSQVPVPGLGDEIEALPHMPKGGKDTLYSLFASMESMYIADILTQEQTASLLGVVDGLAKFHKKTDGEAYIASLLSFEKALMDMSNTVSMDALEHLFVKSDIAMRSFLDGDTPDAPEYVPSDPSERVEWYIDADSTSTSPDGSISDPYPTIAAALDAAEAGGEPGLILYVFGGVYREPLNITRDTIITTAISGEIAVIAGSIVNNTPARFDITGFHLIFAEGLGAVNVNNNDATTVLTDLIIYGAERHGVFQRGGELRMTNVHIDRTQAVPGVYWNGAGIVVTGGCSAVFRNVSSENNDSNGIVADAIGTYLWGTNVEVNRNRLNRLWEEELVNNETTLTSGLGALAIQYGAEVTLSHVTLMDNELISLVIHEGSVANITDLSIYGTYEFVPSIPWPDGELGGGLGIRVKTGGQVEITDFIITHNDLAGILLSSTGADMDLHNGVISHNPIGVVIQTPGYDPERLRDNVYFDNEFSDLDTDDIYVPSTDPPPLP